MDFTPRRTPLARGSRALLLVLLSLALLAGCAKEEAPGSELTLDDFRPYQNGGAAALPEGLLLLTPAENPGLSTRRGIAPGDEARAVAAEYGAFPCDITFRRDGTSVTLNQALYSDFIAEAQPDWYTVTYLLLETGGQTYGYAQLETAPENDEFTIHYL